MEIKDKVIEVVKDEIELKFLKSIILYASKDIKERTVLLNGEVMLETSVPSKFIFGKNASHFKQRTENLDPIKQEKCRSFFNLWFHMGLLHAVFFYDAHWHYFTFYLYTSDNELIGFRTKAYYIWFELGSNTTFFPEFEIFMEENIRNMKSKQTILNQHLDDVCHDMPIDLYNIIAEYTLGFV